MACSSAMSPRGCRFSISSEENTQSELSLMARSHTSKLLTSLATRTTKFSMLRWRGDDEVESVTTAPNHALEATAPRCVAGALWSIGYLLSCDAALTGCR